MELTQTPDEGSDTTPTNALASTLVSALNEKNADSGVQLSNVLAQAGEQAQSKPELPTQELPEDQIPATTDGIRPEALSPNPYNDSKSPADEEHKMPDDVYNQTKFTMPKFIFPFPPLGPVGWPNSASTGEGQPPEARLRVYQTGTAQPGEQALDLDLPAITELQTTVFTPMATLEESSLPSEHNRLYSKNLKEHILLQACSNIPNFSLEHVKVSNLLANLQYPSSIDGIQVQESSSDYFSTEPWNPSEDGPTDPPGCGSQTSHKNTGQGDVVAREAFDGFSENYIEEAADRGSDHSGGTLERYVTAQSGDRALNLVRRDSWRRGDDVIAMRKPDYEAIPHPVSNPVPKDNNETRKFGKLIDRKRIREKYEDMLSISSMENNPPIPTPSISDRSLAAIEANVARARRLGVVVGDDIVDRKEGIIGQLHQIGSTELRVMPRIAQANVFFYMMAAGEDYQIIINGRGKWNEVHYQDYEDDKVIMRWLIDSRSCQYWIFNVDNIYCKKCVSGWEKKVSAYLNL